MTLCTLPKVTKLLLLLPNCSRVVSFFFYPLTLHENFESKVKFTGGDVANLLLFQGFVSGRHRGQEPIARIPGNESHR